MIAPRFRRLAVLLVVGVAALGLTGCASKVTDAATITYTDGRGRHTIHITSSDYKKQLGGLVGSRAFQEFLTTRANFKLIGDQENTTGADLSSSYLSQLVEQAAADIEFTKLGLTISSTERDQAVLRTKEEFALANEIGQDASGNQTWLGPGAVYASLPKWLQNELADRTARLLALAQYYSPASTQKEQALYEEFKSTICPSGRLVAQIQVADRAKATAILAELQAGTSFSDLAKAESKDTTSAKNGGSLGCLSATTVSKDFAAAAFAAPFGVAVGPVKTSVGYHLILVSHPTFADVQGELSSALQQNPYLARDLRLQVMHVWISPQFGTGALGIDSQAGALIFHVTPPVVPTARDCREDTKLCSGTTTTTAATAPAGG